MEKQSKSNHFEDFSFFFHIFELLFSDSDTFSQKFQFKSAFLAPAGDAKQNFFSVKAWTTVPSSEWEWRQKEN